MDLENFISRYSLKDIIKIEQEKDLQFIALKNSWEKIKKMPFEKEILISNFLYLILQNALVSYQLSGKGEHRRTEFAENVLKYFENLKNVDNLDWRKSILSNCKNNCRLSEIKFNRLLKFSCFSKDFLDYEKIKIFYKNMNDLNSFLAKAMNQKIDDKTIVFAVKMFGYGARIVLDEFVEYPFEINIPVDSRLEKIYKMQTKNEKFTKSDINKFFKNISEKYEIPPLHLDSLLWVEYWEKYVAK